MLKLTHPKRCPLTVRGDAPRWTFRDALTTADDDADLRYLPLQG